MEVQSPLAPSYLNNRSRKRTTSPSSCGDVAMDCPPPPPAGARQFKRRKSGFTASEPTTDLFSTLAHEAAPGSKRTRGDNCHQSRGDAQSLEIQRLSSLTTVQQSEITQLQAQLHTSSTENNILKKAVVVQNEKIVQGQRESESMRRQGAELMAHARKLEYENYALKSHCEQYGAAPSSFDQGGNPDVY